MRSVFVTLLAGSGALWMSGAAVAADRFNLPEGPGRELVYGHCQTCHDLQSVVDSAGIRAGAWDAVLDNMRGFGLRISDHQRAKILGYLGTYLGPNPPVAATATAPAAAAPAADGKQVYEDTCIACHQPGGVGKAGEFPPLAGNHDLFLAREFPALVVLNGLTGPIKVGNQSIDNQMPPFDFLSDAEIAAVIDYVRSNFGNDALAPSDMKPLTEADITALRAKPMASEEVHAYRQSVLK